MKVANAIRLLTLSLFVILLVGAILVLLTRQLQPLVAIVMGEDVVGANVSVPTTDPQATPGRAAATAVAPEISQATVQPTTTHPRLEQLLQNTLQPPQLSLTPTTTLTLATPTITSTRAISTIRLAAVVNVDLANLRAGPGTEYAIVGQAQAQQRLEVIGRSTGGDWWQICCLADQRDTHWISTALVALDGAAVRDQDKLPIAVAPPTPTSQTIAAASSGSGGSGSGAGLGLPGSGGFNAPSSVNGLTGLPLPGERAGQRPLIVCINNDPAARPQLGLGAADVVYEYLMEGYGITRFSAIFYGAEAAQIGPVRSARLINYYMGALYDAGLICSGASDRVRYSLKHDAPFPYMDIDLDDPSNARYSVSIGSDYRTRLRTSTAGGRRWLADWGMERAAQLRGFTFGALQGSGSGATTISIPYPYGSNVSYGYDGGSGRYLRSVAGTPHVDGNTGAQLAVENVIVQFVGHEATDIIEDSLGSTSIRINLFGSDRAILFRDGQAFVGSWQSNSRGDLPHFYGDNGQELALKPGKSWISIVPATYAIGYQ